MAVVDALCTFVNVDARHVAGASESRLARAREGALGIEAVGVPHTVMLTECTLIFIGAHEAVARVPAILRA